eukprot:m.106055 g.106055  ORF g.106055 m.106055 type:complete len:55 (+) comp51671_c0_seq2:356-520(+)
MTSVRLAVKWVTDQHFPLDIPYSHSPSLSTPCFIPLLFAHLMVDVLCACLKIFD